MKASTSWTWPPIPYRATVSDDRPRPFVDSQRTERDSSTSNDSERLTGEGPRRTNGFRDLGSPFASRWGNDRIPEIGERAHRWTA